MSGAVTSKPLVIPAFVLCHKCNEPTRASKEQMVIMQAKVTTCTKCIIELFKKRQEQKNDLLKRCKSE